MSDTLAAGRIGWWRFTNGDLTDQSGNGRDLVCVGTQVNTTDKDGVANNAVDLYTGGYYTCPNNSVPLTNFSISMWINFESYVTNEGWFTFGAARQFYCDDAVGIVDVSGTTIIPNRNTLSGWKNCIFVYDSSNTSFKCYVDNVLVGTKIGLNYTGVLTNSFIFGRRYDFIVGRNPNADFDEISMYSRVLTSDERTELLARGVNYNPDTTPPSFNSVSIDAITYNSANLNVNSNETGIVYYKIVTRNATAPTSEEIKVNPTGQANVTANTTSIIPLTGLTSNANLDCYVVAQDTVPNLQLTPTKIQFTTPQAPTGELITSVDKSYKTSINSTSMRFVVKPNTKYTFGLQAIRTTKEGIIATNIIQNTVITTPDKSNFKGVVQVADDANYLYQKTTLRLGQNAIGEDNDGFYVGNTAIGDNPTNFMKFSTTTGTFDLKSTGNINISNTANEINFDSTTSNNSFISMNGGSQQIGRVNLTNMSATFDKITGNVGNYTLSASGINLTGVFSIGDSVKISQSGKVNTLGKITNISFLGSTTITIDSILLDNYTSAYIYKLGFNGFYIGNTNLLTGNEFYKDSLGLNFSGKYFNKTAYCNDSIEFLGALDTSKSIVKNVINPFFGKIVNDIVLTNKDDFNIQLEFLNYTSALILDYANLASFPTSLYGTPTKFRALDTGIIYIQDYIDGDVTPSYKIYNINTLQYRGTYLTENDSFLFSALSTINGIDFVSKYYAIPLGKSRYKISTDLLGATSTTLSEGVAVISLINPAYSVGAIDLHFGQLSYIAPSSDIKSIKSIHSSDECTIDFCSVWDGHSNYGSGLLLNNEIIIENVRFKNIGSKDLYNGTYYSILLQSSDIHLNNINILNLKSEFSCNNSISSTIKNIRIENYDSSLIAGLTNFVNADNITLVATKSLGVSNSNLIYNGLNIKNLIITTPLNINKNLTISPSANGFIQGIDNISNIHIDGNLYSTLFYQCNNITNINIINNIIDNTSISNYYFKECTCITNGRVAGASSIPNNVFLKDCSYITNFSGITITQTSGLINDMNNSWNTTSSIRTLVADSAIVRSTWTYFDIELVPQKFKIVLYGTSVGAVINTEITVTDALTSLIIELEMYDDGGTLRVRPISNVNTGDEVFVKFTATQLGIKSDINGVERVVIISETF